MSSTRPSAAGWRAMQVPRPLQRLFDRFPLLTYDANELPARSQHLTSGELPTLYIFSTDEDARLGLPSFNPGCLKWQTLLRLSNLRFRTLPSTNHASPTGSLPFLLPARPSSPTSSSPSAAAGPIPADKLLRYAQQHGGVIPPEIPDHETNRAQAYLALVTLHLRNAWLHALYLDPAHSELLQKLYIAPASSSGGVQAALAWQLRRAAAEQIVTSSSSSNGKLVSSGGADAVDEESVYAAAGEALEALAALLAGGTRGEEGEDRWFFGVERPTWFDAAVFSYTHLMMEFMGGDDEEEEAPPPQQGAKTKIKAKTTLGAMVQDAGTGELARHRRRMLETAWPGWDGRTRA